jgi:hypothetical protein
LALSLALAGFIQVNPKETEKSTVRVARERSFFMAKVFEQSI